MEGENIEAVAQLGGSPRKSIFVYPADTAGSKSRSETPSTEHLEVGLEPENKEDQGVSTQSATVANNNEVIAQPHVEVVSEERSPNAENVAQSPEANSLNETGSDEAKGDEQPTSGVEATPEVARSPAESMTLQDGEVVPAESSPEGSASDLSPPPPPPAVGAPTAADFETFIANAITAKTEATEAYKKSDLLTARLKYLAALEHLQQVQGDLSNKTKSTLFEQTVTNNNNVALCCIGLEDYVNCVAFATNSLILIRSLEKNIPDGQIWQCLLENGITEDQLRKVWKKKALYYAGKAQLKRKNYQESIDLLEEALSLTADDAALSANTKELKALVADAKTRMAKEKQKEKSTWSKAFQKGKLQTDDGADTAAGPEPTTPTTGAATDINNLKFDLDWKKDGGSKNKKKSAAAQSSAVSTWTASSFFSQYGVYFGLLGVTAAVAGAAVWYTRYRRR